MLNHPLSLVHWGRARPGQALCSQDHNVKIVVYLHVKSSFWSGNAPFSS